MNLRQSSPYVITALMIFLVLVALVAGAFYTFAVGTTRPTPTPTVSVKPNPTTLSTPVPEPAPQYPEQANITNGLILMGVIIIAIILFGTAWGTRMTTRNKPKSGKK